MNKIAWSWFKKKKNYTFIAEWTVLKYSKSKFKLNY